MTNAQRRPTGDAVVHAVFFLSGASALVYQTAWHRLLGLFSGADSLSSAVVVGAFLLGLGLGSLIAGLFADRLDRRAALLAFAACELGIGAYASATPWLFHDILFGRYAALADSRVLVFVLAFGGLVVPTVLMGLSLPLLARAIVTTVERSARDIGVLYFINTLGAGIGALGAGWWLIGHVGYDGAVWTGAVLNALVGVGALGVAAATPTAGRSEHHDAPVASESRARLARWCILVFASGFVAVSLQIVWYRLVGVLLQGNAYAFSLVLGLVLIADALGMAWGARLVPRLADPERVFLLIQAAVAASAVAAAWALFGAFGVEDFARHFIDHDALEAKPGDLAAFGLATFLLIGPSSVLIGFTFPLAQRAVQDDARRIGRRVGWIQLFNIAGNSAGSLGTGLVLVHVFGTAGTLRLVAAVGLLFLWPLIRSPGRARAAALGLAALVLLFPANDDFWQRVHRVRPGDLAIASEDRTGVVVLRHRDGAARMFIQGHAQSGVPYWTPHVFLGVVGALVHPEPRRILAIGVGSGGTPYAAGVNPKTYSVRAVEIVEPVYDVIRRFAQAPEGKVVASISNDPRFELAVGDGRRDLFLRRGDGYDVIQADAILPKTSHSGLLYSREFFAEVRAHLRPGGIAVQWAPTDRVRRTFRAVFPHVVEVHPALLGSDRPIAVDRSALLARLDEPAIVSYLERAKADIADLRRWISHAQIVTLSPGGEPPGDDLNTDLFPRDEYYLNR